MITIAFLVGTITSSTLVMAENDNDKNPLTEIWAAINNLQDQIHKLVKDCSIRGPGVDLSGCNLKGADLSGANLSFDNLDNVNLSGANLQNTKLVGATM